MPSFFRVLRRTLTTMSQQGDYSVAFVTIDKMEIAKKLAAGLVKEKHAACVNIIPGLISVYEWEGKINEDPELLLKIKTATSKVDDVIKYVRENHPYDVAEVISFKVFFITLLTELSIVSKIEICDIKEICIPNYKHVYQLI
ncbi:protein CutA homolog isoform X2 [Ostrea edulis]|uniref:protein CutA homolog isoform X2 n=1 Tax=Ostrea edulis TaxID=37623 RepID=UPI0024AEDEEB|nr:protein CutA homolog isoform X2 [Ostrea edulis]